MGHTHMSHELIFLHRKYKLLATALVFSLMCLPHATLSTAPAPVDYLVPPPLQQINVANTRFKSVIPQNLLPSESRTIPKFINPQLPVKPDEPHPGIMARVARWFGFANQNSVADQQLTQETNKQPYYYQKPQQQQYVNGDKENCYLCNKYPWVPMMQNSLQFPQASNQWDGSKQTQLQTYAQIAVSNGNLPQNSYFDQSAPKQPQNSYAVQSLPQILHASSNVKQRAVKFNFPLPFIPSNSNKIAENPNHIQYSTGPFLPIPVPPHLNSVALPPLYSAQNFLHVITPLPNSVQELPSTEPAHFVENIGEHSEIHLDTVIPTQIPPTTANKDASFEIVKSHQLVDYVSSVEYPASYVPSHTYDVSSTVSPLTNTNVNTGLYLHSTLSPHLSHHVPASQLLTEPGSFVVSSQQQTAQQTEIDENTTIRTIQPQALVSKPHLPAADDSYVAASQRNSSVFEQTVFQQQQQLHHVNYDAWTLESNDFAYTTPTPELLASVEQASTLGVDLDTTSIQSQIQDNEIELVASIQTNAQQSSKETNSVWPAKQRETPKRLLDSPIQHFNGNLGEPRPFTRDPADLTFRLPPSNHKLAEAQPATISYENWKQQISPTELPNTSSTFSSLDASGQYAGMSPPSLPSTYNSDQILLPQLTTKNRPRPFETTRTGAVTRSPAIVDPKIYSQNPAAELHTPQESMLVRSHIKPATTTTTIKPRTTKYLTRILASNLRELLQREHEPAKLRLTANSLDIDINKLQKNIDDWTEQEYTSLSHRPSTPTIRGRSKHIPSEYLTATTATVQTRQSKTTKSLPGSSELPSSINNLEPLYERGSTKHYQYTQITDNHLKDFYNSFEALKSKAFTNYKASATTTTLAPTTTPSTTTSAATTTTKALYLRPIQIQEPEELWKKAKVSISPKTQEKVYVVTPQPRFFAQRYYSPTAAPSTTTTESPLSNFSLGSGFKSPRFLVRPTPGNDTETKEKPRENNSNSYFSPEWFGLRGLSAYIPAEPVEIIDGNSKVLNIVTPPSDPEKTTQHSIMDLTKDRHSGSKRKSTMAPLPR